VSDLDRPVTKTTGGLIVLPRTHHVMARKLTPTPAQNAIGKSACDQCRYCTEYCPRYLLGYAVEPHQVMRGLAFTGTGEAHWNQWASLCCACGLCTLFACPEELFPKEACDQSKVALKAAGCKWSGPAPAQPHALRDGRRVPIKVLMRRLHIEVYDHPAPLHAATLAPARLVLPLKQSAGVAARPIVEAGARVTAGQPLAAIPADSLGAALHAPADATVSDVTAQHLILTCS
jgi:Na+-translocating ferredoxin:NAD+ oxidoreductase RnfC subunit